MPLTDIKVRTAKSQGKPYKLADGAGLYLLIHPNGGKYWRFKYRVLGKEKLLAFGKYPDLSLVDAREMRDTARNLHAKGMDPAEIKREQEEAAVQNNKNNFENVARDWHELNSNKWSPYYAKQIMQRLEKDVFPQIGSRPVSLVKPKEVLKMAKSIEARDALEMSHRAVQICGQVFQYAIITDKAEQNPAAALRGALKTPQTSHYAYLSERELPQFLSDLNKYDGHRGLQTKLGMTLLLLTFVRTSELCGAKWEEIDFDRKEWRIPAERMKMKSLHVVPLSKQALAILQTLKKLNGKWDYVFPNVLNSRKCMSNNTMLYALYTMGYKDKTTIHGFRATASTILNESGEFERDVIERQLAHQERNRVRAAYDHAEHLSARRQMMQWWADYLTKNGLR